MDLSLYFTFILASMVLILVPGPNVLVIVSTSVYQGTTRGLQTVLGTSSAMLIQLIIAATGTAWFVNLISGGFQWLRWAGIGYLLFLGFTHFQKVLSKTKIEEDIPTLPGTFSRGFIVSLTNPKTILFFGTFLPQFVSGGGSYVHQIAVLSFTFLILATILDSLYAVLAGYAQKFFKEKNLLKLQHGLSGGLFAGAGVWFALARKG